MDPVAEERMKGVRRCGLAWAGPARAVRSWTGWWAVTRQVGLQEMGNELGRTGECVKSVL